MYLYPEKKRKVVTKKKNKYSFGDRRPKRTLQTKPELYFENVDAYNLYTKIKPWLDYNSNFELIIDGQVIPNTDVTRLIDKLTTTGGRKSKTPGILELQREMKRRNIKYVQVAPKWNTVV